MHGRVSEVRFLGNMLLIIAWVKSKNNLEILQLLLKESIFLTKVTICIHMLGSQTNNVSNTSTFQKSFLLHCNMKNKPLHQKSNNLHMRKQRRRSAVQ